VVCDDAGIGIDSRAGVEGARSVVFVDVPNTGIVMKDWTPKGTARTSNALAFLKPLEGFREIWLVCVRDWPIATATALGDGPGDHRAERALLPDRRSLQKTPGADIQAGRFGGSDRPRGHGLCNTLSLARTLGLWKTQRTVATATRVTAALTQTDIVADSDDPDAPGDQSADGIRASFRTAISVWSGNACAPRSYPQEHLDLVAKGHTKAQRKLWGRMTVRKWMIPFLRSGRSKRNRGRREDNRELTPSIEKTAGIPITFNRLCEADVRPAGRGIRADLNAFDIGSSRVTGSICVYTRRSAFRTRTIR
jgi:hypothetical protein